VVQNPFCNQDHGFSGALVDDYKPVAFCPKDGGSNLNHIWCPATRLCGVTSQISVILMLIIVKTSNLSIFWCVMKYVI